MTTLQLIEALAQQQHIIGGRQPKEGGETTHCVRLTEADRLEIVQAFADAARWRAIMNSGRIRVMGSAGFGHGDRPPDPDGHRHMGVELWSIFRPDGSADVQEIVAREHVHAVNALDEYVAVMTSLTNASPPES